MEKKILVRHLTSNIMICKHNLQTCLSITNHHEKKRSKHSHLTRISLNSEEKQARASTNDDEKRNEKKYLERFTVNISDEPPLRA